MTGAAIAYALRRAGGYAPQTAAELRTVSAIIAGEVRRIYPAADSDAARLAVEMSLRQRAAEHRRRFYRGA